MGSSLSKSHLPRNYWPEETGQVSEFKAVQELQVLADDLPADMRAPLTAAAGLEWSSLHQALAKIGRVVEQWRYAFETESVSMDEQHLEPLIPAIREMLTF